MEGLLVTVIIVVVVVWYFGSAINSIISKSGKMAEREYEVFERDQSFRLMKGKEELKHRVAQYQKESKSEMTDEELDKALGL